jgi:hypothetical protein
VDAYTVASSQYLTWQAPRVSAIPAFPQQIALAGSVARGWTLVEPLLISIEREDNGWFVLSDDIFPVYGDGATLEEARADYVRTLIDYYELLATRARENAHDARELEHLRVYVRPDAAIG